MDKRPHVVAKPVHQSLGKRVENNRRLWATVCYYYPQYTLEEARKLTIRDIRLLLGTAKRMEAQKMLMLTQIAAAPHTKNGKGVKQLTKHFQNESQ